MMVDDRALADAVVALGVGVQGLNGSFLDLYHMTGYSDEPLHPEQFVTDWRVAGALMEKAGRGFEVGCGTLKYNDGRWTARVRRSDWCGLHESLPRAIIEACVEALK